MEFLSKQTKSISSASLILAVSYFLSAFLGLMRDRLLAGSFGAGNELDVYYAAFTVPDFIALILIFGAIAAAIIPIFSSYLAKSKEEAWEYASSVANVLIGFLILVCLILIIFAPYFVALIAPGFSPEKRQLTASLMRIMFLSPIILGMSNIMSGILQVFHRFLATAFAPIMYNLGIIIGILFFYPAFGLQGLAWGVVLGGLLHLSIQLPAFLFSGFRYKFNFKPSDPGVKKTIKLMVPRSLGLGAGQLNTIAVTAIASTLVSGSVAVFNLANNLSSILVNAVAVSLSTAVFPSMSMAFIEADQEKFLQKFSNAFRQTIFLIIPISLLILILRVQIVRVILGAGKFGWADTRLTTACLGILSVSLFAQGLIFILSKTFYAAHNTKIPAIISGLTVIFIIILSFILVSLINFFPWFAGFVESFLRLEGLKGIGVVGLALAFSITALLECFLLLFLLYKKFSNLKIKEISDSVYKILIASLLMVVFTFLARQILGMILNLQLFWAVFFQLTLSGATGVSAYLIASHFLKSQEIKILKDSFLAKFLSPSNAKNEKI